MFEDLSETAGEVLAKGQVMCMSPSLRDLPTHTQSYGKTHTHTFKVPCFYLRFHLFVILTCIEILSNVQMLISGEKRVVQLSLRSTETGHQFITTSFIYYNCSVLSS